MTWDEIDWAALDRLRELFLSGGAAKGGYWGSMADLENYDFTYGRRIGWKWDAVLLELVRRGWRPPCAKVSDGESGGGPEPHGGYSILDWGCGSGVAGRQVVGWLGADRVAALRLWDRSALAAGFAAQAARRSFSGLRVEQATPGFIAGGGSVGVLVISHVLNELAPAGLAALEGLALRADAVLWVEPGTHEVSRALLEFRGRLRDGFRPVAPCTHDCSCGLLATENARHWCHHFAAPPAGVFTDSNWVKFGRRAGVDLRSLPYSFLALERRRRPPPDDAAAGFSRVIGEPRTYRGFARVLSCDAGGVSELMVQKRDNPALFRRLGRPEVPRIFRWTTAGGKIVDGEPLSRLTPGGGI